MFARTCQAFKAKGQTVLISLQFRFCTATFVFGALLGNTLPADAFALQIHLRGVSSAGRASALQAEGHRFDPDTLHQDPIQRIGSLTFASNGKRQMNCQRQLIGSAPQERAASDKRFAKILQGSAFGGRVQFTTGCFHALQAMRYRTRSFRRSRKIVGR
jgi:hypothetical protein